MDENTTLSTRLQKGGEKCDQEYDRKFENEGMRGEGHAAVPVKLFGNTQKWGADNAFSIK